MGATARRDNAAAADDEQLGDALLIVDIDLLLNMVVLLSVFFLPYVSGLLLFLQSVFLVHRRVSA